MITIRFDLEKILSFHCFLNSGNSHGHEGSEVESSAEKTNGWLVTYSEINEV